MPARIESWEALRDTSRATTWWGDFAHGLGLLCAVVCLLSLGVPFPAAFLAYWLFVTVPFAVVRRRRWRRLGRKDPALHGVALALFLVAVVVTMVLAVERDWSLLGLGLALAGCEAFLWTLGRALVRRAGG